MPAKEHIRTFLEQLASDFPNITVKYRFDRDIWAHLVELTPLIDYYSNSDLDDAWIPFSKDFDIRYRGEGLVFVTTDSDLAFSDAEAEFILNGTAIDHETWFTNDVLEFENEFYSTFLSDAFEAEFTTHFDGKVDANIFLSPAEAFGEIALYAQAANISLYSPLITQGVIILNEPQDLYTHTQYAMAA